MSPEERAAHAAAAEAGPFGQSKAVTDLLRELARVTAERDDWRRKFEDAEHLQDPSWTNVYMLERERDAARAQMRQLRDALMGLQDFECIECGLASEDDEPHRPDCVVGAALAAVWPEPKP